MNKVDIIEKALQNLGITAMNTLQETCYPAIAERENTVILAPTGSGKTLGFLLPILSLLDRDVPTVQCMIITPTRELAIQIERVWQKMGTGFKVNTCYGGHPMPLETQNLSQPPALLIGTPGRLSEHLYRGTFNPKQTTILVLDEFDKCLTMGFQDEISEIIRGLHFLKKRILVSATDKQHIPAFTGIQNPKVLNFYKMPEVTTGKLQVFSVISEAENKGLALFRLLCHIGAEQTLIFCNQRDTTEDVRDYLTQMGIPSARFHGGMDQPEREKTLVQFRNGTHIFLVTSDLAARGLDIPEVRHVVHLDIPIKENDFTHRNGRTARMDADGNAYLLVYQKEVLPAYLPPITELTLSTSDHLPAVSEWTTVYISGGKKDKLSKTDIVGFFTKKGELPMSAIGKIEIMDFMSFVAVKKDQVKGLLQAIQSQKMKGQKYKIAITN